MELSALVDLYQQRKEQRETRLAEFFNKQRKFIVIQRPPADLWGACNSIEQIYANNLAYFERQLSLDCTDELPYLEPWIGTGLYATAFGCEYKWREDNAPDVYYRYRHIEEVRQLDPPDYLRSPVMRMVLECIDYFKEKTRAQFPICLTDTQSPFDTSSLILDAAEFLTACYAEPETVMGLMRLVTDLIVEFSRVQQARIGEGLAASPGHIMPSQAGGRGISLSDDNLSFCAPALNEKIPLFYDQYIAEAMGGVALHSCGAWESTMARLKRFPGIYIIDCALSTEVDPNPNSPTKVRDAMKGSGILLKARVGSDMPAAIRILDELFDPSISLCVEINYDESNASANYRKIYDKLDALYA